LQTRRISALKALSGFLESAERDMADKQAMREEAERLMREAMAKKNLTVKQGDTRIMAVCGKCGAPNKVTAAKGETRVKFTCKECGVAQTTI
jgi:transposase-like protein